MKKLVILFALSIVFTSGSLRAEDWDSRYIQTCVTAFDVSSIKTTEPIRKEDVARKVCNCTFHNVANSSYWGSVTEPDLIRGLPVLRGETLKPSGLPKGAPQTAIEDDKAFINKKFGGFISTLAVSGMVSALADPAISACYGP